MRTSARYERQEALNDWGPDGQRHLAASHALIVGAGGLGSPAILYLAGAGVGHLTIVDPDLVAASNLHRQVIHSDPLGGPCPPKALSAAARVAQLNPDVRVRPLVDTLTPQLAQQLLTQPHSDFPPVNVVVDCTDNVASRYLVSDAVVAAARCLGRHLPLVSAAAVRWHGSVTVLAASPACPCYRCLNPLPPAPLLAVSNTAASAGVAGPAVGVVGCAAAAEALKLCLLPVPVARAGGGPLPCAAEAHYDHLLCGRQQFFDVLRGTSRTVRLRPRQPHCAACGASADAPPTIPLGFPNEPQGLRE
jgi:adenylyltransferase/sulfurtransferase